MAERNFSYNFYTAQKDQVPYPQYSSILDAQKKYQEEQELWVDCKYQYNIEPKLVYKSYLANTEQASTTSLPINGEKYYAGITNPTYKYDQRKPTLRDISNRGWVGKKLTFDNLY
jgi:hypothetical protein